MTALFGPTGGRVCGKRQSFGVERGRLATAQDIIDDSWRQERQPHNAGNIGFHHPLKVYDGRVEATHQPILGFTGTDLNQHTGSRTPQQGAAIGIRLATLPDDGSTGGFFDDEGTVAW